MIGPLRKRALDLNGEWGMEGEELAGCVCSGGTWSQCRRRFSWPWDFRTHIECHTSRMARLGQNLVSPDSLSRDGQGFCL